jgi:activator of HSP90 ATPase
MKIIIKESQYQRLLLESNHMNFYDNFPIILEELLQVPEFREDLKEHSYNKNKLVHWWKRAKEDMEVLIRDKYCKLFKQLARKYKFKNGYLKDSCVGGMVLCLEKHIFTN